MARPFVMQDVHRPRSWRNYCLDVFLVVTLTSCLLLFFALAIGGS